MLASEAIILVLRGRKFTTVVFDSLAVEVSALNKERKSELQDYHINYLGANTAGILPQIPTLVTRRGPLANKNLRGSNFMDTSGGVSL